MSLITGGSSFNIPLGNIYYRRDASEECSKSCLTDIRKQTNCAETDDKCLCKSPGFSGSKIFNCIKESKTCQADDMAKATADAGKWYFDKCQPFLDEFTDEAKEQYNKLKKDFEEKTGEYFDVLEKKVAEVGDDLEDAAGKAGDAAKDAVDSIGKAFGASGAGTTVNAVGVKKMVVVGLLAWGALAMM